MNLSGCHLLTWWGKQALAFTGSIELLVENMFARRGPVDRPTQVEKTKQGNMHNVAPTSSLILERTSFASFPLTSQSKVATTWRNSFSYHDKKTKRREDKMTKTKALSGFNIVISGQIRTDLIHV